MKKLLFLLAGFLFVIFYFGLSGQNDKYTVAGNVTYLETDIVAGHEQDLLKMEFRTAGSTIKSGATTTWLKVKVPENFLGAGNVLFSSSTEMIPKMDFYFSNSERIVAADSCNLRFESENCRLANLQYAVPLSSNEMPEIKEIYIKIQNERHQILNDFYVMKKDYYNRSNTVLTFLIGLTVGISLIIAIYCFSMSVAFQNTACLSFGIYALFQFFGTSVYRGFWDLIKPSTDLISGYDLYPPIFFLGRFFEILFLAVFFKNEKTSKFVNYLIGFELVSLFGLAAYSVYDGNFLWSIASQVLALVPLTIVAVSLYHLYRKSQHAMYFLLSWGLGSLGYFIWALNRMDILAVHWFFAYAPLGFRPIQLFLLAFYMSIQVSDIKSALRIARLNASKDNVVKTIFRVLAHDLSNLSMIIDVCSRAGKKAADLDFAKKEFENISQSIKRQNAIVRHYKEIYLKRGQDVVKLSPVNLNESVKNAAEIIRVKAARKNIQVVCNLTDSAPMVMAEEISLTNQVLVNLLDNAVKYSDANTTIRVSVEKPTFGNIVLKVEDEGIGLSKEMIELIFSEKLKIDRSRLQDSEEDSTGHGLLIVRDFIFSYGGTVKVTRRSPKGTQFLIKLEPATEELAATF